MVIGNVTGWSELIGGHPITASWLMWDTAFAGWMLVILFFTFEAVLYIKIRKATLAWVIGLFTISVFTASDYVLTGMAIFNPLAYQTIFLVLALQLAGILFVWLVK